ncbi:MAG TPA: ABC transporter substrate-binding protein [Chloroflexota bacterium]|nr:ABC transporter substrate-binding protein [Chloroflexota bacterium]
MKIPRRSFVGGSLAWTTLLLAGCGSAAAPASSPSAPSASPSGAASKPVGSAPASAKPAASAAASAKPAAAAAAAAVNAAWVALTANQMLWPLAVDAGLFDKYGVKFNLTYIQGSVTSVQALKAGDLQTTEVAGSAVVAAQAVKQDLVMTVGFVNDVFWRIMAPASITSVDQLRGKTVAVTKIGNADYFAWTLLAKQKGWSPTDFTFVAAGNAPGQVALLSSGQAQALALSPPNDVLAQKVGAHLLLDESQFKVPEAGVGMAVSKAYLAQNRQTVLNVAKATVEAIHRWKTDPAFAKGVIKKYLKQSDQQFIDTGYAAYTPLFPDDPLPSAAAFQTVIDEVGTQTAAAKSVTPAQCIDTSIMKELEDSGFVKQILSS